MKKLIKIASLAALAILVADAALDLYDRARIMLAEMELSADDGDGNPCHMACAGMATEEDFDDGFEDPAACPDKAEGPCGM